jgi:hypothetical protein
MIHIKLKEHKENKNFRKIRYDLISKPSLDTNWCETHDHVVTQPITILTTNLEMPK